MNHGSPARYTHGHSRAVLSSHASRTAENSAAYLLPHLCEGQALLDVGCGPATITVGLAEHVAPGRVVALDAAEAALTAARATLEAQGSPQVELTIGDALALPYPDDTFDVVHAHQVLQHLADPVAALAEMRHVTKPGGLVREAACWPGAVRPDSPTSPVPLTPGAMRRPSCDPGGVKCGRNAA